MNPYEVLGVSPGASQEEIKKALDDARNAITSCQSNVNELFQSNRQTLNKVMG